MLIIPARFPLISSSFAANCAQTPTVWGAFWQRAGWDCACNERYKRIFAHLGISVGRSPTLRNEGWLGSPIGRLLDAIGQISISFLTTWAPIPTVVRMKILDRVIITSAAARMTPFASRHCPVANERTLLGIVLRLLTDWSVLPVLTLNLPVARVRFLAI